MSAIAEVIKIIQDETDKQFGHVPKSVAVQRDLLARCHSEMLNNPLIKERGLLADEVGRVLLIGVGLEGCDV